LGHQGTSTSFSNYLFSQSPHFPFHPTHVEKGKWSFNLKGDCECKEMIPLFVWEVVTICNTQEVAADVI